MLKIGLTGGIGSGKTAASDYFATKGITIVDADVVSRQVVEPGQVALQKIEDYFGNDVINSDSTLNRAALRKIVFDNPDERLWLEKLLHPAIAREIQNQIRLSQSPYTVLVSPLLFESGQHIFTNRTLVIDAPEALQIERTSTRDKTDEKSVKAIMEAQTDRVQRLKKADDVIVNDGDLNHLYQQIDTLHQGYLTLAQEVKSL